MMKLRIVVWIMVLAMAVNASAQEPELKVKPSGRILFDAAYVHAQQQEDKLKGGVGTPDMRIGVGFSYGQWKGKIDMGFAYGKVNMKDVFLQYDIDKQNFLRGGYFIHQYGYQSCTSSSFKETMEEPQSNAVFNNDRMMGLMFEHMDDRFLATASVVAETDAMKQTTDVTGNEAVGAMARLVYHPFTEPGKIFHVGVSGGYLSDWALCYNYYINKYMIWRVRGSWTKVTNRSNFADNEVSIFETRLQVKF